MSVARQRSYTHYYSMTTLLDRVGQRLGLDVRYFATSGFWVAVRYVGLGLLSLATTTAFARLASPHLYGQYQYAFSLMSLVSVLSLPGLNILSLRNVAAGTPRAVIDTTTLSVRASWLITLALLSLGATYYLLLHEPVIGLSLIGVSLFMPLFYGLNAWYTYYEGQGIFRPVTIRVLGTMGAGALWLLVGLWRGLGVPSLLLGYVGISSLSIAHAYRRVQRHITDTAPPKFPITVRTGVAYTLQKFSGGMQDSVQQLLVSWMFGYEALGSLLVGYVLINSATGLMGALSTTYFPQIMRARRLPHRRILLQQLAIGLVLTGGYYLFARLAFIPLFGSQAQQGYAASLLLAGGLSVLPLRLYFASYLTAHAAPSLLTVVQLTSFALAVLVLVATRSTALVTSFALYYYTLQLSLTLLLAAVYWRAIRHVAKKERA